MQLFSQTIPSPIGNLFAIAKDDALILLDFCDSHELEEKKRNIQKSFSSTIQEGENLILTQTKKELSEYFAGIRKTFSIPLEFYGTDFQEKSWQALRMIPYGETRNYLEQATMIGNPKAVRAIGGANHRNPIIIIIPCHRVIGKNKSLTGYAGGIERKKWLLEHERKYN
ncbi:MAG: methylated-DNA--[protein]-cysteine S-methyltransferase [Candidatus Gracilibacteria bacterium]|nr:methylated-DNA--[protein]-cysteine S-methyltransferase [Candidatus Gracilibacteria bacterium]